MSCGKKETFARGPLWINGIYVGEIEGMTIEYPHDETAQENTRWASRLWQWIIAKVRKVI